MSVIPADAPRAAHADTIAEPWRSRPLRSIRVNGKAIDLTGCYAYDIDAGWVCGYVHDTEGHPVLTGNPDQPLVTYKTRGEVTVEWEPA